jgi:hypothetical protein
LSITFSASAELYKGKVAKKKPNKASVERCSKATGSSELSVNNVRARINTGGTMWNSESVARYYVPKDGQATSMFAAALWIGGQDENGQLRVAAMRFGSEGDDFWPGPLSVDQNASVDKEVCEKWDRHFRITKAEVDRFRSSFTPTGDGGVVPGTYDPELLTDAIREWPATGDMSKKQSKYLAPFYDADGDGVYDYTAGDYPYYDFDNALCPITKRDALPAGVPYVPDSTYESRNYSPYNGTGGLMPAIGGLLVDQVLKGDETLWWVFNDKGNAHTETGSPNPIGLEIRAQAFAFTMNNEINNMTFYSYEIINRSTFTLQNTYFSQWVDPDLGYSFDDYVGCDVKRGLGYCYNGKAIDGPGTGAYSGNPPAVGIDFFQGPYMDPDGQDNPKVDTNWFYQEGRMSELDQFRKDSSNGPQIPGRAVNQILLTDAAENFLQAWYPVGLDSAHTAINACAINGVNFGNGIIDDERFGMRRFVYYNNDADANNGEPKSASHYYNYLRGIWQNNQRMKFGGNGYNSGITSANADCDFMFPGNSDIWNWGTQGIDPLLGDYWTEEQAGNAPSDRRFMQSAGPFTLKPGAINYITVGIPWAQAASGGPMASVELLRVVDDKCQTLFDNCFNILEGPDAPNLTIQELDRGLILYLTNEMGNNVNESFDKLDPQIPRSYKRITDTIERIDTIITISLGDTITRRDTILKEVTVEYDRNYHFEGYQIFQVKDANVKVDEIYDNSKARLVAQCDIKNDIKKLINYDVDQGIGALKPQAMVDGADQGISHSFQITEDMFAATNDRRIVNNQKYYYIAIAYAQNNYKPFDPTDALAVDGQKQPYLAGRKLGTGKPIEPVMGIPHKTDASGNLVQSSFGMMPEIFRIEGNGNSGVATGLKWQQSTVESLMGAAGVEPDTNFVPMIGYEKNYGPVNIKIVDPLNVKAGNFVLKVVPKGWTPDDTTSGNLIIDSCYWALMREDGDLIEDKQFILSDRPLCDVNEQIIPELGISITMTNPAPVANALATASSDRMQGGDLLSESILYGSSNVSFVENNKAWLSGIADNNSSVQLNWIRSGSKYSSTSVHDAGFMTDTSGSYAQSSYDYLTGNTSNNSLVHYMLDPQSMAEKLPAGWAPYRMTSFMQNMPGFTEYYFKDIVDTTALRYKHLITENPSLVSNDMNNLASVDIVFTSDKSKWTRCPVIEMGTNPDRTEGNARKFQLRRHASVDKNGQPDSTGNGMGWFPGYAINLETGERLNIVFGENSMYGQQNGRDMQWNPTDLTVEGSTEQRLVFGGMHYIYVLGTTPYKLYGYTGTNSPNTLQRSINVTPPRYDAGKWAYDLLKELDNLDPMIGDSTIGIDAKSRIFCAAHKVFGSAMWVGMPLASAFKYGSGSTEENRSQSNIPTTATVALRVRKPYNNNWTSANDTASSPQNDNRPMYMFAITSDIGTIIDHKPTSESALDLIAVVPNPYFAASTYELDRVQNLVKITNVPVNAYITIYTVDGTVVRKLRGPSSMTTNGILPYVEWDLKNHKGLPISGGMYLIHIKADGIGERLIKWFGALRPVDLNSFPN